MQNRRVRQASALVLFLLLLCLQGCGRVSVHEELKDKSGQQVTIRVAWWGGEERHKLTREALELYSNMHPEITFEMLTFSWNDYFETLSLETARGNMPDLVQMDYQYITTYSENGSLSDLTPFVEDGTIRIQDMDSDILRGGEIDGALRGIATGTSVLSMIYNPRVFEEAGLAYPENGWTWEDFADCCKQIKEKTGKYGVAMTPILDVNLFRYWVRQQGSELFSADQRSLGYEDDNVYIGYVSLFKELMDAGAAPTPEDWAAINARGEEHYPVVIGEGGLMQEWNNFSVKMSHVNDHLRLVATPLSEEGTGTGLWMKPGMFLSIAETSEVKRECAQLIDWLLNSEEANRILKGERGVPISKKIRESLLGDDTLSQKEREMFQFVDEMKCLCGEMPPPEPAGIEGINQAFSDTATAYFYDLISAGEAAGEFRERVQEILNQSIEDGRERE